MSELAQLIRYYDEVLTQSARNFALTKDPQWERRYHETEPQLAAAIEEALEWEIGAARQFLERINRANLSLVRMERRCIELVQSGQSQRAVSILDGADYQEQKQAYAENLEEYSENRRGALQTALLAVRRDFPVIELSEEERTWLAAHPAVRLGFNPDMEPLLIEDSDGGLSGILPELFEQLEGITGVAVTIEVGPWPEIIEQARQREIDGLLACVPALAREAGLLPTADIAPAIPVVYGRRDAPFQISGLDDLKGKRVAHLRGSMLIEDLLATLGNETTIIETNSSLDAMIMVLEGKADVAFGINYDTYLLTQKLLSGIGPVFIDMAHEVNGVTGIRSDWPELAGILNKGFAAMGRGRINEILGIWTQFEMPGQRMTPFNLTEAEQAWLDAHPVVDIHLLDDTEPYSFRAGDGSVVGIVPDVLKSVEQRLPLRFTIIPEDIESNYQRVVDGNTTVTGIWVIEGLEPRMPYEPSRVFVEGYPSLFGRPGEVRLEDPNELQDRTVAYLGGVNFAIVKELGERNRMVLAANDDEAFSAVMSGRADYALTYSEIGKAVLRKTQAKEIRELYVYPNADRGVLLVHTEQPLLLSIINKALADIETKELPAILEKWYRRDVGGPRIDLTPEEEAWLDAHPVTDIYLDQSAAPYNFVTEGGTVAGITADLLDAVEQRVGVRFRRVAVPSGELSSGLQKGEFPVQGIWSIQGTSPDLPYKSTRSFVKGYVSLFGRTDEPRVADLDQLSGKTIAVLPATHSDVVNRLAQHNETLLMDDTHEGIGAVLSGQADYFLEYAEIAGFHLRQSQTTGIRELYTFPEPVDGMILVHESEPLLLTILDKAIADIGQNELPDILGKWYHWGVHRESGIELTSDERAWLAAHPVVTLCSDHDSPPYNYMGAGGQPSGITFDILDVWEQRLGIRFDRSTVNTSELSDAYSAGETTLIGLAVLQNLAPDMPYNATDVVVKGYLAFFGRDDSIEIENPQQLTGKTIVMVPATNIDLYNRLAEHNAMLHVERIEEGISALLSGRADYYVTFTEMLRYHLRKAQTGNVVVRHVVQEPYDGVVFVHKDEPLLLSILNKAIADIEGHELPGILSKWYGREMERPQVDLTEEERVWLKEHRIVRVATDPYWEPIEFRDETGEFRGVGVDYLKALEELLDIRFESVPDLSWQELVEGVKKREIDMFSCLVATPERSEYVSFTQPYITLPVAIFARDDVNFVGDLKELQGEKIAVVAGYGVEEWLVRDHPELELIRVTTTLEALDKLQRGEVYAFVGNLVTTGHYLTQMKTAGIKVAGNTPYQYEQTMAVRNDWPILRGILQKALDAIPEARHREIQRSWLAVKYEHGFDYTLLWRVVAVSAAVLAAFLYWNRRLSREVTHRKRAQGELRMAKEAAEAANRAKSAFLANMSHEIRTPMNAVLGYAQLMQHNSDLTDEQRECVHSIDRSGKHLLALINDVLDMSKIEAGRITLNPVSFDLRALVDDLETMFRVPAQARGLQFSVHVEEVLPQFVEGDEGKVRQVLVNLLGNAVKFTDAGGVTLRACLADGRSNGQLSEGDASRIPAEEAVALCFEVEDTGRGIEPGDRERIFQAFEQSGRGLASEEGSTGLGLALSREFAEAMGGDITVESEVGGGSCFRFCVPVRRVEDRRATGARQRGPVHLKDGHGEVRVLVVDDKEANRDIAVRMMTPAGFAVREAVNGEEAVRLFQEWRPQVVLMDVIMPVMDGREATKRIRELERDMRDSEGRPLHTTIIAISASVLEEEQQAVLTDGADMFLAKPIREGDLLEAIRRLSGLEYVYEEGAVPAAPQQAAKEAVVSDAAITRLPADILEALRKAAVLGDVAGLEELIPEVRLYDDGVAEFVHTCARHYKCELLLDRLGRKGSEP